MFLLAIVTVFTVVIAASSSWCRKTRRRFSSPSEQAAADKPVV
jgi:hypothetical protein